MAAAHLRSACDKKCIRARGAPASQWAGGETHRDSARATARGRERRGRVGGATRRGLAHHLARVANVPPSETVARDRQRMPVLFAQVRGIDLENLSSLGDVREAEMHRSVEARTQRRVEIHFAVGGRNHQRARLASSAAALRLAALGVARCFEPVEPPQQHAENAPGRLVHLAAPLCGQRIDLVDEEYAASTASSLSSFDERKHLREPPLCFAIVLRQGGLQRYVHQAHSCRIGHHARGTRLAGAFEGAVACASVGGARSENASTRGAPTEAAKARARERTHTWRPLEEHRARHRSERG